MIKKIKNKFIDSFITMLTNGLLNRLSRGSNVPVFRTNYINKYTLNKIINNIDSHRYYSVVPPKNNKLTDKIDKLNKALVRLDNKIDSIDNKNHPKNIYELANRRPFLTFFIIFFLLLTIDSIIANLSGRNNKIEFDLDKLAIIN